LESLIRYLIDNDPTDQWIIHVLSRASISSTNPYTNSYGCFRCISAHRGDSDQVLKLSMDHYQGLRGLRHSIASSLAWMTLRLQYPRDDIGWITLNINNFIVSKGNYDHGDVIWSQVPPYAHPWLRALQSENLEPAIVA
jgi:hypothetical protein